MQLSKSISKYYCSDFDNKEVTCTIPEQTFLQLKSSCNSLEVTKLQLKTNKQLFEGIGEWPKADRIWSELYWVQFTFIIDFPIEELPCLYGVGQLEFKQPATVLLVWGVTRWSLWLKLRKKILERMKPQREGPVNLHINSPLVLADLWTVNTEGRLLGPGEKEQLES